MTLWIKNANIATMDKARPHAQAAVVIGGFFACVGSEKETEAYLNAHPQEELETIDCGGNFVMSGFNDSHMHYLHYVRAQKTAVDLYGCTSLKEVLSRMRRALEQDYDPSLGLWLTGEGWNHDYFTDEQRFPTAKELDAITTEYPILIMRACFHIGVMNSKAMELMNINKDTVGQYGVYAETYPDGTPNGVIKEGVFDDIKARLPMPGCEQLLEMMIDCQKDLFECGITSIQSDDFKYCPEGHAYEMMALLRTAAEKGRFKLRMAEQALLPTHADMDEFFNKHGFDNSFGNRTFKINCVKLLSDGSLGARTAYMRKPYADDPTTRGIAIYEQEELNSLVLRAHSHNMPAIIHAIGDGAVEMCLNAIENARLEMPHLHPRHGIVHCQITDKAQVERFKELDVIAYIQPVFINYDMHIVYDRVGKELGSTSYAWADYIRLGVHAPFGTDCPVESFRPLPGIYCAVTGRDLNGSGPFLPQQILDRETALYCYSAQGAYCTGEEGVKGKIKEGMYADFIVLDKDLVNCTDMEILEAKVLRTFVNGKCVYER